MENRLSPFHPSRPRTFSLVPSHSGEYALVAVARGREVGVDVEVFKANMDCVKLAERFFAPREAQAMATPYAEKRSNACFIDCGRRRKPISKGSVWDCHLAWSGVKLCLMRNRLMRV